MVMEGVVGCGIRDVSCKKKDALDKWGQIYPSFLFTTLGHVSPTTIPLGGFLG